MGLTRKSSLPTLQHDKSGEPGFVTTKLDFVVNWARRNSLWPMPFGTACCAIEMMATFASRFDAARFGMERMSFSPRQADVLICAGRVSYKMAPILRRVWDFLPVVGEIWVPFVFHFDFIDLATNQPVMTSERQKTSKHEWQEKSVGS